MQDTHPTPTPQSPATEAPLTPDELATIRERAEKATPSVTATWRTEEVLRLLATIDALQAAPASRNALPAVVANNLAAFPDEPWEARRTAPPEGVAAEPLARDQTAGPTTACPECGCEEFDRGLWYEGNEEHVCRQCGQSWFRDVKYSAPVPPPAPSVGQPAAEPDAEAGLRRLLAFAYAGAGLYGDDGELQDGRHHPCIDFRRDSVSEIERKMGLRARAALGQPAAGADPAGSAGGKP